MSSTLRTIIIATALLLACSAQSAKQGVFLLSNQPTNQVGVWESLDDGSLLWQGRYNTGGVGYPDPNDADNLDDLGSSNAVHYHVWNNKQWLLTVNPGGPAGTPSLSIFEVTANLTLVLTDTEPMTGIFACTVAAFGDRACAASCGGDVILQCFQISPAGTLTSEFTHNFRANLPAPAGRPNSVSAALGPGNVLFTPSGDSVGVLFKGIAGLANQTGVNSSASFQVFPVLPRGSGAAYGRPLVVPLSDGTIPFAFAWAPGASPGLSVAFIVQIAGQFGNFPACDAPTPSCRSAVTSVVSELNGGANSVRMVGVTPLNVIDACWIEYFEGYVYTGNFFSDSMTIASANTQGGVTLRRSVPIGRNSIPNDLARTGAKLNGDSFLYTENQGTLSIGVQRILAGGSQVAVLEPAPVPSGMTSAAWRGNNGIAATTLTQAQLNSLYA